MVEAVAASCAEMTQKKDNGAMMKRTLLKAGMTVKLDGSTDNQLSPALHTVLSNPRGCSWDGEECSFFEWRKSYLASLLPPKSGKRDLPSLLSNLENPYTRDDKARFLNASPAAAEESGKREAKEVGRV